LVELGRFPTRARAKAAIMAGVVYVDGRLVDKAGALVSPVAEIAIRAADNPYVSRGGLKLERALDTFAVDPAGRTCLDVGASTGGFTDCLLQRGAAKVYAVDVGYGQLAWSLRQDPRVVVLERTNFRHIPPQHFRDVRLAVIDVSFISLVKILPAVKENVEPEADVIALVKPQFEAGRAVAQKGAGVVRDPEVHAEVLLAIVHEAGRMGWSPLGLTHSPIAGPKGNIEFLLWLRPNQDEVPDTPLSQRVDAVVREAHHSVTPAK